jgi:hypothetical protein
MTDVLRRRAGLRAFTWGAGADLVARGDVRRRYLAALRSADLGDIRMLLEFAVN